MSFYNCDELNISYLPIPKCGSTTVQKILNSSETNRTEKPKYHPITFVRNPFSRFVSGYNEVVKRGLYKKSPDNMLIDIYCKEFHDPHVMPQYHYIGNKNITMMRFEDMQKYFFIYFGIEVPNLNKGESKNIKVDIDLFCEVYEKEINWYSNLFLCK